jgi:hypothetical protein
MFSLYPHLLVEKLIINIFNCFVDLYILFKQEFEIEFVPSLQIRKMNSGEGWSRPLWRHLINQMRK